jgi:solute carrier family 25 protein 16
MSSADAAHMEQASMAEVARNSNIQNHGSSHPLTKSKKEPSVCPTDQEAVTPKPHMKSLEYVWKSGVAGGLAGCAVSD